MSDAFYKYLFFLNYSTLLYAGDQLQYMLVHCFGVRLISNCLCVVKNECAMYTNHAKKRKRVVFFKPSTEK